MDAGRVSPTATGLVRRAPDALYATPTLRNTKGMGWWRPRNQRCEPLQVLGDGGQHELILGASWTTQLKPAELQDALQVREPHLDLPPRLMVSSKLVGRDD